MNTKLFKMSDVGVDLTDDMDSVKADLRLHPHDCMDIVLECQQYFWNLDDFRREFERCWDYAMGNQWGDIIDTEDGPMTEEDYLKLQGNIPLKNNLIWRTIRNIVGVYRNQDKEPTAHSRDRKEQGVAETISTMLQYLATVNNSKKVNAKLFIQYLVAGLVAVRKGYSWDSRHRRMDVMTKVVDPKRFFFDTAMETSNGEDVSCVGMIHDLTFNALCEMFAHCPEDYAKLRQLYHDAHDVKYVGNLCVRFGERQRLKNLDFLVPNDISRCRVIEVWRKERRPRYHVYDMNTGDKFKIDTEDYDKMVTYVNRQRIQKAMELGMSPNDVALRICDKRRDWFMDNYWYFRYLTPTGEVLSEGETPYTHKGHPFVFSLYPFINGRVHSLVKDVIDQQRYINRLITLYDWVMRARTKESVFFPEECLPQDMTLDDLKEDWAKIGNLILIKKGANKLPQPVQSAASNFDINTLLNIQLKMFEDVSGVNGALQGKPGYSQTSGVLYQQQAQNAATSLIDQLEDFSSFIVECAYMDVDLMQQYYSDKDIADIAGADKNFKLENISKIRDARVDISISESTTTPAYRLFANQTLERLVELKEITAKQMLKHGEYPFADALLQDMEADEQRMAQGEAPQGISPEVKEQVQGSANQDNVQALYEQLLNGSDPIYKKAA